ncbi:DUF2846 domain-containing protein [Aliivibrio fischeri]|uniref:DUF2846 domain-containing protein n=1 Tax=Aliivibrio fischeri TaxID=668 RepID=UPI0012D8FC3C|nr:DUF2846 domain-containing protein [Aliivibrio fischeri]MUK79090.1 DUF2846 domain-containing protein [Aliivibrio fischeri]
MNKVLIAFITLVLSGCASVPTAPLSESSKAKQFLAPSENKAGVYVYRKDTPIGGALKKDVYINKECVGETAKGVFFYQEVEGGKEHFISTESEFSPNGLTLNTETGRLYFIEQYLKPGFFVGGANVKVVDEEQGKSEVIRTQLAVKGTCTSI